MTSGTLPINMLCPEPAQPALAQAVALLAEALTGWKTQNPAWSPALHFDRVEKFLEAQPLPVTVDLAHLDAVDAELDATAAEDAQPAALELLTDAVVRKGWQHTFSTENPFCPCDLKSFTKAVRWTEMKMLANTRTQHDRDSKELRKLCHERDELRRANKLLKIDVAALEYTVAHLGRLVDELRPGHDRYQYLRERNLDTISTGGVFAGMTPENVVLNGIDLDRATDCAIATDIPPAAVAEGLERDGSSLEQAA